MLKYLFCFFTLSIFAQNQTAIHYSQFISAADIKQNITVLASDSLEGRETGKPGQIKAANYIAKQYDSFGIPKVDNVYFQKYAIWYVSPQNVSIYINKKELSFMVDFYHHSNCHPTLFNECISQFQSNCSNIQYFRYSINKFCDYAFRIFIIIFDDF